MESTGGSLRQLFGIGGFNIGGLNCNSGTDANPAAGATVHLRSVQLWNNTFPEPKPGAAAQKLTYANWTNKLAGTFWLVRPDEPDDPTT